MAGCCGNGGEDEIPPDDVEKWTTKLSNVLNCSRAKEHFGKYLEKRNLKDAKAQLDFWKEYDTLLKNTEQSRIGTELMKTAKSIKKCEDIGFNGKDWDDFVKGLNKGEEPAVKRALEKVEKMLEEGGYVNYSDHLLKRQKKKNAGASI